MKFYRNINTVINMIAKILRIVFIISTLICTSVNDGIAQSDIQTWSSVMLSGKLSDKVSFGLRPMIRYKNRYSDYSLTSMDLMMRYKLGNGFSLFFMERHALRNNGINRNLMLLDVRHSFKVIKGVKFTNSLRWHLAHDLEMHDPNYLCFLSTITFINTSRFTSFVGIQYFYKLDGINEFSKTRYRLGISYKFNSKWKFSLRLWNTEKISESNSNKQFILLPSLVYSL